jgi:hypothetical protein
MDAPGAWKVRMELSFLMLAPYGEITSDGKVSVLSGDLDTLRVAGELPAVPATPLYFLGKVVFPPNECGGRYPSRFEIIRPDGQPLQVVENVLEPPPAQNNRPIKVAFVIIIAGVALPAYGEYTVRLVVAGRELKAAPLYIERIAPDAIPGGSP